MLNHNRKMQEYLSRNNIEARVKYIDKGSQKGTWRLYNPAIKWTVELAEKLTGLGFVDFDGRTLGEYSSNGGNLAVFIKVL